MQYKLLVVEDDKEIANMIAEYFSKHNYLVRVANDGMSAITMAREFMADIVILDVMLPYKSGDEVLKELRRFSTVPVIVVSAKGLTQTKIDLLHLGADDYLVKPFDLSELLARVEVNLRRSTVNISQEIIYQIRDLVLDTHLKIVTINDNTLSLTLKEYELLVLLLKYPNKIFSKQNLYEVVWKDDFAYDNDTINTHISNVRKKIKKHTDEEYIETIWGIGYKMLV